MLKFKSRSHTKRNIGHRGQAHTKSKPISMGLRNRKPGRNN